MQNRSTPNQSFVETTFTVSVYGNQLQIQQTGPDLIRRAKPDADTLLLLRDPSDLLTEKLIEGIVVQ